MTTAEVVDSPTPLAPPVVVKPQEQLTCTQPAKVSAVSCQMHSTPSEMYQEQIASLPPSEERHPLFGFLRPMAVVQSM